MTVHDDGERASVFEPPSKPFQYPSEERVSGKAQYLDPELGAYGMEHEIDLATDASSSPPTPPDAQSDTHAPSSSTHVEVMASTRRRQEVCLRADLNQL
jgi:hypothetical protein